jgi:hypothetical protein
MLTLPVYVLLSTTIGFLRVVRKREQESDYMFLSSPTDNSIRPRLAPQQQTPREGNHILDPTPQ